MRSPMLVAGGEAVVPAVAEAVAVARERGIFLVWVSFAITGLAFPIVISAQFLCLVRHQHLDYWVNATRRTDFSVQRKRNLLLRVF